MSIKTFRILGILISIGVLLPRFLSGNVTITTTTNGTQIDGYFNETNSISIQVDLDNITTNDLNTYGSGGIFLKLAWAEDGDTPSSFDNMSSPTTVAFSSGTATITVFNSHLTSTNTNPNQDNFDLRVGIADNFPIPTITTTEEITFEGSNSFIKYDVSDTYASLSYPGGNFNTYQVAYSLSEDLSDNLESTVAFIGTSGSDNGTSHTYTLGTQSSDEKQSGATRTITLTGQTTAGDILEDNLYTVSFSLRDAAGNTRGVNYSSRYYDTENPTISSLSSEKSDGTYPVGTDIEFTVTFSEAVTATGSMVVTFETGTTDRTVTITSGNIQSTTSVSGTYTVQEGDETSDLSVSSIQMASGVLEDAAGNDVTDFSIPNGQNVDDSKQIEIDGVLPTIASISSSSVNGFYSVGEDIDVTVTFSESVSSSGGNSLIVTLETGTTDRTVSISSISSVTSVAGTYTVQEGDATSDLSANSVALDAGSLTDAAGNTMTVFSIPGGENINDDSDIVVETTAPTIGSVTSTATDGTYGIGSSILVTVNFVNGIGGNAETVTLVGGDLIITLETGSTDRTVTISSISGVTSAIGTYTVQEGDVSSDLSVSSISLSGGATLSDAAGNQISSFDIPGTSNLNNSSNIVIETTRPTISSVTSTSADGTYKATDAINITVSFSEGVTLSGGNLEVLLETGDDDRTVTLSPFSNSTTASGLYTVQSGDESSDLNVNSISLGVGASLNDVVTTNANSISDFNIPAGSNLSDASDFVVDGIAPTISSIITTSNDGYYKIGDDVNITVNFSEPVTLSGSNLIITLETGDTDQQVTITTISGASSSSGTYTVQSGDESSDLSVSSIDLSGGGTFSDAAGNSMSSFSIPDGQNLDDTHGIIVDGVVPIDFTVGSVTSTGGTSTADYWNVTNSGISIVVPMDNSDASFQGGTVQLQAEIDGNSFVDLGASSTITGSEVSSGTKTVTASATGTGDTDVEDLTGFGEGGIISIRAVITDVAGNSTIGTESGTTLTIDETSATIDNVVSTAVAGLYGIGGQINLLLTFTENVTLTGGNLIVQINASSNSLTQNIISNSSSTLLSYIVAEDDESTALSVDGITPGAGTITDIAGNPTSDFTVPDGANVENERVIIVDGIYPVDQGITTVSAVGDPVVAGYWNEDNTNLDVTIPLQVSDNSLVNGTIQLKGKVLTAESYTSFGNPYTIQSTDVNAGSKVYRATELEFEEIDSWGHGSSINISVTVSDEAGNITEFTEWDSIIFIDVDDPPDFTVGDITTIGGFVQSEFWNGTNTGLEANIDIPNDNTLVGGSVTLLAKIDANNFSIPSSSNPISGGEIGTTKIVTLDLSEVNNLAGFANGGIIRINAILADVAGNSTQGTVSSSTLEIDTSAATVTEVTSTELEGTYGIGAEMDLIVSFSSIATLDAGNLIVYLNSGGLVTISTFSGDEVTGTYTVAEGESAASLSVDSVVVIGGGTLRDVAGNPTTNFSIPSGENIEDDVSLTIDGIYPTADQVMSVTTVGDPTNVGFWNSNNTALKVAVPLDNDASLLIGTIQLTGQIDGNITNIGSPSIITTIDITDTITVSADDFESDLSLDNGDIVFIAAVVTDIAGNGQAFNASDTTIIVDQIAPVAQIVGAVSTVGGNEIPNFWNSTNASVEVVVPLQGSDTSLENGTIQLQAEAQGTYEDLGDPANISALDLSSESKTISVDRTEANSTGIEELAAFSDDDVLSFKAVVTDVAGNSTQFTQSNNTLTVDETDPTVSEVTSPTPNGYYNEGDTILVHVVTDEQVSVSGLPVPLLELDTDTTGVSGDNDAAYIFGTGSDTLVFRYSVIAGDNSNDLDYSGSNSLDNQGSQIIDVAGNPLNINLPVPGNTSSFADNKDIILDTKLPFCTLSYSDSLVGLEDNTLSITASMTDFFTIIPTISIDFPETSNDISNENMTVTASDSIFTYFINPLPDTVNGTITVTVEGNDKAGNALLADSLSGTSVLRIDTQLPIIENVFPDSGSFVNHTNIGYTIVDNSSDLESGVIVWEAITVGAANDTIQMIPDELEVGTHGVPALANDPTLVDGILYRMIYSFVDSAENQGTTGVDSITYDITSPSALLTYSSYLTRADSTVTITATFSEQTGGTPSLLIEYNSGAGDSDSGNMTDQSDDSTVWSYNALVPSGLGNNDTAMVTITTTDRALNSLTTDSTFFRDTLLVDNSTASLLSIISSDSLVKELDVDTVRVVFSEPMRPSPMLEVLWASGDTLVSSQMTEVQDTDSTEWIFIISSVPDSNDGFATVVIEAFDDAGNPITSSSSDIIEVDNVHPTPFLTGSVEPKGSLIKTGWFNEKTDSVAFTIPIDTSDNSLYLGQIQVQMQAEEVPNSFTDIGITYTLNVFTPSTTVHINSDTIRAALESASTGSFDQGRNLLSYVKLFDLAGNFTLGTISTDTLTIDTIPPLSTDALFTGGVVSTADGDTVVSSDAVSAVWTGFVDDTETGESGIEFYEWSVGRFGSSDLDSMLVWTYLGTDTSSEAVVGLRHLELYSVNVRANDLAGNRSDTLQSTNGFLRFNSPPQITEIDSQTVEEDVQFSYQVEASDFDLATLLGDTLQYSFDVTGPTSDTTYSIAIDDSSGLILWNTPVQSDTGIYQIKVFAQDSWLNPETGVNFTDSTIFYLTVSSVNDTPQLFIDTTLTFIEGDTTLHTINLNQYVTDVDNDTSELTWDFTIFPDTSDHPAYPFSTFNPNSGLSVSIDTTGGGRRANFTASSNYYTSPSAGRKITFTVKDQGALLDIDTLTLFIANVNDPPVITAITDTTILENDSLTILLQAVDIDDSASIVFTILPDSSEITVLLNDSLATLVPEQFWSEGSNLLTIVSDGEFSDSTNFYFDIIRALRPHLELSLAQNAAFSHFYDMMITDTAEVTTTLNLTILPLGEIVELDSIAPYTWTGHHSIDTTGSLTYQMVADALVGDTIIERTASLVLARGSSDWTGISNDGMFRISGDPGTVSFDTPFMIVDSTLFPFDNDGGLYRVGFATLRFDKPVLIAMPPDTSRDENDQAIYLMSEGGYWREIPTLYHQGMLNAWIDRTGKFKLDRKTIVVPEVTALHQNYPNPFNAQTQLVFDIGFFGGPDQRAKIVVFNILGQEVETLFNGPAQIGHHEITWNGKNKFGQSISSGVYIAHMVTNQKFIQSKKMMIIK